MRRNKGMTIVRIPSRGLHLLSSASECPVGLHFPLKNLFNASIPPPASGGARHTPLIPTLGRNFLSKTIHL
jgi:hypothetical protein